MKSKSASGDNHKRQAWFQIVFGLILLTIAETLMFLGIEPFASCFYPFVWWSYIIIIDGVVYHIQRNSLIINRTREFLVMIPWSVIFWLFFEMTNVRMGNWHYSNVIDLCWIRWTGYFISFATVVPGVFETTELLACWGFYSGIATRKRVVPKSWFFVFYAIGIVSLLLPLIMPRYGFPLIWIGFIFLLEPINYVHRSPSLLRDWEEGYSRTPLLLLSAGLICGFLWEFWNYWAATKWIYTLPFFNDPKLFEMPLAGYLGFPPFAVECYVTYHTFLLLKRLKIWDQRLTHRLASGDSLRWAVLGVSLLVALLCTLAFLCIDNYTVISFRTVGTPAP
ncbi:MAG: hypothetical protein JXD19_01605 [Deltaproteobacteria bacterium]|nr:hypothetical protein [Deltaproteobacteria bacterium]